MLHAGSDLSRKRLDVCLLSKHGELVEEFAALPDGDGLRALARRVIAHREPVRGVIESMTGARFVHDTLEELGWDVLIADAQKVKGLAPLACKTDKIDARVLAVLSERDLVPEIWLPDPRVRREREQARFRMHLVRTSARGAWVCGYSSSAIASRSSRVTLPTRSGWDSATWRSVRCKSSCSFSPRTT
jgi:transposase